MPRRRPGASVVELDDNVAVYDDVGQLLILLNAGAAAVWEGCDGATTFAELTGTLAKAYAEESPDAIAQDAWRTVRRLADLGLVDDAAPGAGAG
jgi:coenzyme PQQ synthesis protein D (PqqD)